MHIYIYIYIHLYIYIYTYTKEMSCLYSTTVLSTGYIIATTICPPSEPIPLC